MTSKLEPMVSPGYDRERRARQIESTLFVVQNDTHAKNFDVMARQLVAAGETVAILLLDGATHENTEQFLAAELGAFVRRIERTDHAFYRSRAWDRVRTCKRLRSWARAEIGCFDRVVVGNDGAMQKIIIKAARIRNGECRVSIVLDGLLTREKGWGARAKRRIQRVAERLGVDEFVPSTVGASTLVDDITVMHSSVADVLRFHRVAAPRITVAPLPRHAALRSTGTKASSTATRVLFLGSAYLWHGEYAGHRQQLLDFAAFSSFAGRSPNFECRLRIHPRDDASCYAEVDRSSVHVSDGSNSLEDDLAWADVVVASRSSGLFDATLAGRRALVYTAHFPAPTDDAFLCTLPQISKFEELYR